MVLYVIAGLGLGLGLGVRYYLVRGMRLETTWKQDMRRLNYCCSRCKAWFGVRVIVTDTGAVYNIFGFHGIRTSGERQACSGLDWIDGKYGPVASCERRLVCCCGAGRQPGPCQKQSTLPLLRAVQ